MNLKFWSTVLTVVGAGLGLTANYVDGKIQDENIEKAVEKKVNEKFKLLECKDKNEES